MASWTNYFRIVKPEKQNALPKALAADSGEYGAAMDAMGLEWYSEVMRGIDSRIQKYQQYDNMDAYPDVARALDTIAEEMANKDRVNDLAFEIDYQVEEDKEVSETVVTTIRAALRQWINHQDFENRIFRIGRYLIKYGDCFFVRESAKARWKFIEPKKIVGIEVNQNEEKISYHTQENKTTKFGRTEKITKAIPANQVVHFSLSDEMGEFAPFGESVLNSIIGAFKKLTMLEDSTIIYRIVRAPERRVFYIDVGNMPPQRVKQYLEQIKNDMRQKRTVSQNSGSVDGTYNVHSTGEDIFFPVTVSGRGSRVETLPGGENLGELAELKFFQQQIFRGLRIPTSYMQSPDGTSPGAQYNDGKVGIAYIEELRFANFVKRLQSKLERIFDREFKIYLNAVGIKIDDELFQLKLPDPQNFALYRQAQLDSELINTFNSADQIKYLSKRFIMKRYLGFSEDDIQMNEIMIKQERSVPEDANLSDLQQIYDPAFFENREAIKLEDEGGGDEVESPEEAMAGGDETAPPTDAELGGGAPEGGEAPEPTLPEL